MGLKFFVNQSVLIPRNDTEVMVVKTLECLKQKIHTQYNHYKDRTLSILELGTGSGAIAISIWKLISASYNIEVDIIAVDNSPDALKVAEKNAEIHQANITFQLGNWFNALKANKKFDVIVSNPPYINKDEQLDKSLDYEPKSALYADENGLSDIKILTKEYNQHLHDQGIFIIEHGYQQANSVRNLLKQHHNTNIKTYLDLAGKERFTLAAKL